MVPPGDDPEDPRVRELVENARGTVEASTLTRVGTHTVRWGTFHDRPLVEYLREGEQPHYVLANLTEDLELGGVDHHSGDGYWQAFVVTDQRLLLLAGEEGGDRGIVVPYGVVDPDSLDTGRELVQDELRFVANGIEVEVEDYRVDAAEVAEAADYVARRAREAGGPDATDLPEADRPKGPVYGIPDLSVPATVWQPGDRATEDDADDGFAVSGAPIPGEDPVGAEVAEGPDADDPGGPDLSALDDPPPEEALEETPPGPDLSVLDGSPHHDGDGEDNDPDPDPDR